MPIFENQTCQSQTLTWRLSVQIHRVAPLQQSQVPLNPTALAFDTAAELLWLGTDQVGFLPVE